MGNTADCLVGPVSTDRRRQIGGLQPDCFCRSLISQVNDLCAGHVASHKLPPLDEIWTHALNAVDQMSVGLHYRRGARTSEVKDGKASGRPPSAAGVVAGEGWPLRARMPQPHPIHGNQRTSRQGPA